MINKKEKAVVQVKALGREAGWRTKESKNKKQNTQASASVDRTGPNVQCSPKNADAPDKTPRQPATTIETTSTQQSVRSNRRLKTGTEASQNDRECTKQLKAQATLPSQTLGCINVRCVHAINSGIHKPSRTIVQDHDKPLARLRRPERPSCEGEQSGRPRDRGGTRSTHCC